MFAVTKAGEYLMRRECETTDWYASVEHILETDLYEFLEKLLDGRPLPEEFDRHVEGIKNAMMEIGFAAGCRVSGDPLELLNNHETATRALTGSDGGFVTHNP